MRNEMQVWSEFLDVWPPDRVRSMSLDNYTSRSRDDFISWLEHRTRDLGSIAGGDAIKFGIYRRATKDPKLSQRGRIYGDKYAWRKSYGETAEAAFDTVRSRLTDVVNAVRAGKLEAVEDVDFSFPLVKWKVAFLYQDREDPKLLALYNEARLKARYEEAFPNAVKTPPIHEQHAALIDHYSWLGGVLEVSAAIWLDPKDQPPPEPPDRRYWLMSLGRQSRRWQACYESGTASIGYDNYNVGDLHRYGSLDEVGRAIQSDTSSWPMHDRLALWEFSHVMKPGDTIFVKRGNDAIGHGTVRSDYRYDGDRDSHRHVRHIEWESNFPDGLWVREKPLVVKTLTDITKYPDQVRAFKEAIQKASNGKTKRTKTAHSRNQILYGPPGTGKTYSTVSHALAIVDGVKPNAEVTEQDGQRFRLLRFKRATDSAPAEGQIAMVTFHQNYAYEDFVEGIRPALTTADGDQAETSAELGYELRPGIFRTICKAASDTPDRNFVLIIDEINRGNIPKIFGELMTLIEDSRRLGENDATTVTLPYSGDDFGIPNNLYIIGTMNTADRSIQQLDTALRRRFTFVEMMPNPEHKLISEDVEGVNCRRMLRAMNERIAVLLDREHQIGHTYLLNVKNLDELSGRFRNGIFPLLQEYFYDDWRKVRAVLGGNAFVKERKIGEGHVKDLAQKFDLADDETMIHERLPLDDPAWENASEYKVIYTNADRE